MLPRYPVYVPSRNRYQRERAGTMRALQADAVPFYLVVEPAQVQHYRHWVPPERMLVLPQDDFTLLRTRNWIRDHAEAAGAARHWQLDDNVWWFARLWEGRRIRCHAGVALRVCEDLSDRYENVGISGLNYDMFVHATVATPFYLNAHVYSMTLVNHAMPYRWRLVYNDDTDICLQALTNGWCTILLNAFMGKKQTTMTLSGGNTDDLYKRGGQSGSDTTGRYEMARVLEREWPGTVKVIRNFGRFQHAINWRAFDVPLKPPCELELPEVDEYGMSLRPVGVSKSPRIRALVEEYPETLAQITQAPNPVWRGMPAFRAKPEPTKLTVQLHSEEDREALIQRLGVMIDKRYQTKGWSAWWPPRGRDDPRMIGFVLDGADVPDDVCGALDETQPVHSSGDVHAPDGDSAESPLTGCVSSSVPDPGGIAGGVLDGSYDPGGPPVRPAAAVSVPDHDQEEDQMGLFG